MGNPGNIVDHMVRPRSRPCVGPRVLRGAKGAIDPGSLGLGAMA